MITTVENATQKGGLLQIDNKYFINCKFDDCVLIYSGGDCNWSNTVFNNCTLNWLGDASRTVSLLAAFGYQITTQPAAKPPKEKLGFSQ